MNARSFLNAAPGTLLPLNSKVGLKLQDWKNIRPPDRFRRPPPSHEKSA
jgi:hypothetical protein